MALFRKTVGGGRPVEVRVDGERIDLPEGEMLAAALLAAGYARFSDAVRTGEPRGPLCLMGTCYQCAAEIDGDPQARTCRAFVRAGMDIKLRTPGDAP